MIEKVEYWDEVDGYFNNDDDIKVPITIKEDSQEFSGLTEILNIVKDHVGTIINQDTYLLINQLSLKFGEYLNMQEAGIDLVKSKVFPINYRTFDIKLSKDSCSEQT